MEAMSGGLVLAVWIVYYGDKRQHTMWVAADLQHGRDRAYAIEKARQVHGVVADAYVPQDQLPVLTPEQPRKATYR
jgi:hypothetical protein